MATDRSTSSRSILKSIPLIVAASLLITPLTAFGEGMTFRQVATPAQGDLNSSHNGSVKKARLGLDDEGNLMVRYGDLSASLLCDAEERKEHRNFPGLAASGSDTAMLENVAIKISIKF